MCNSDNILVAHCFGNGDCQDVGGVVQCVCNEGYAGDQCDYGQHAITVISYLVTATTCVAQLSKGSNIFQAFMPT